VPTQSAASSVAATPPPAFLRCRLSGTLDDGAPLGIIQQRDFGGFRGRFHRRPVTRRWRSLSFSDGGSGDDWFASPGELAGREWCHGCNGGVGGVVVTAGDRRVVRFSQPGLPAGGRELAGRRFPKRMSSRWSPGRPSVFRSRWGSRRSSPRAGSIPSSGWWVDGGFSCARDVFAVPTSPPAGVLPVGARASRPAPRRGVMTGRSERIARTTNPPLLRLMPWQPMLSRFCDCGQRLTRRFPLAPIGIRASERRLP
jgi:hypothetical protein